MPLMNQKRTALARIQVYLSKENRAAFQRAAAKYERTESDLARILVDDFLKREAIRERQAGAKPDGQ